MIVVTLPPHLRTLADVSGDLPVDVTTPVTICRILDALEAQYPMLRGTIREHVTKCRRPFLRFFACGEDVSHASADAELPAAIATGAEPFMIVGAIAGG